jgi:hypothetical protein
MSKFIMSQLVFAATLAAVEQGADLQEHGRKAVSYGVAPDLDTFVSAFLAMKEKEGQLVSFMSIHVEASKLKPGKNKTILAVLRALAEHNKTYLPMRAVLSLSEDGTSYTVSIETGSKTPKPRKTPKPDSETSANSRISAFVACERGIKAGDDFTIQRVEKTADNAEGYCVCYPPNRMVGVKRGKLSQWILENYANDEYGYVFANTNALLVKYGYVLRTTK